MTQNTQSDVSSLPVSILTAYAKRAAEKADASIAAVAVGDLASASRLNAEAKAILARADRLTAGVDAT